uniref:Uncharacterized protein n=1 Tax=Odontella aurita TaxID=265563 RepID=A0A7S4J5M5_9STRA|mmetsp:Transcript_39180/g.117798  ORF Transcript_39180/g.117798 Transcript_39180/m.117798 type:complete len:245 (+) Transcript_39180:136-870(+)
MAARRIAAAFYLYACASVQRADAADVTMGNNYCDEDLPVYASDMYLDCGSEGDGCHLGSYAGVGATLTLSGLSNNGNVYVSVKVSKFDEITSVVSSSYSVSKEISTLQPVSVCNSVTSYGGGCPADGTYTFKASYLLPTLGDKDWFLTGQHFGAEVQVFSDEAGYNLVGDCHARLSTTVTASANSYGVEPPSAAKAAGITAIVFAVSALLICAGCAWMDKRDKELEGSDFEMLEDPRSGQNAVV